MRKNSVLSSFFIKIAALLFMTFDHVGLMLAMSNVSVPNELITVFRGLGRLALPLFVFMVVEGVIHTKNIKNYLFRLGIMAGLVSLFFIVAEYSSLGGGAADSLLRAGNIFLDLTLLAVTIYLLKQENNYLKLLTLLPLAWSILSFVVKGVETANGIDVLWLPAFLTLQYDWFSIVLGVLFFYSYKVIDLYISINEERTGLTKEIYEVNGSYRLMTNIVQLGALLLVSIAYYLFSYFWPDGVFWNATLQLYAIFSGAFILLYNGKRGYNAKWFQYGSYLYYPLHLIVIAVIYIIINGGI